MIELEDEVAWGRIRHERTLMGESTAFHEICERYLDSLMTHVWHMARRKGESNPFEGMITDAVTTALFNYRANPKSFNPERSALLTFLKMSSWGDYRNLVDKRAREQRRFVEIGDDDWNRRVDAGARGFEKPAEVDLGNALADRLMKQCAKNDDDRLVFEMLVDKIRDTETCLKMLNWPSGAEGTERLRNAKDRIDKCIKRAGRKLAAEE
jgi:hypothetical protein